MGRDFLFGASACESTCVCSPPPHHRCRSRGVLSDHRLTLKPSSANKHQRRSPSLWAKWSRGTFWQWIITIADVLVYALVIVVCIFSYANSLDGDFVHDDLVAVTTNPDVLGKNPVSDLFTNDFWGKPMGDTTSHKSYRPLTVLTFRLNYIFCGLSPWGYHLVNVLLHAVVCTLITFICLEVLMWSRGDSATAALLFATHPIHTEAVSNIVGRAEVLSAVFFLASLLCFTKSAKSSGGSDKWFLWLVMSLCGASLALLAKEQGIAVLPVCIAWRILQLKEDNRSIKPKSLITRGIYFLSDTILWISLIMFVMLVAFRLCMLQGTMPQFSEEDNPASFCPSMLTRFFTYSYLATFNSWLLLNPMTLSYDWQMGSLPLVTSWMDIGNVFSLFLFLFLGSLAGRFCISYFSPSSPTSPKLANVSTRTSPTGLTLAGFFKTEVYSVEERDLPPTVFREIPWKTKVEGKALLLSLSVIVLPFLPASNLFVTVGFVVAERVLYIPSVGFCILVTYGLKKLRQDVNRFSWLWKSLTFLLIMMFVFRTIIRNQDWTSREAIFRSGLKSVPHNAKVHYNFANLQKDFGNVGAAVEHYKVALKLWPNHASAHNNLGTLLASMEEAENHFRSALVINPQHPRALFNLASLYSKQGRTQVAQELLQRALELDEEFTEAYSSLATLHAEAGRTEEAETLHLKALAVDPQNADSYNNYGTFLQKSGRVEEAVQQYKEAIRLQPNHTVAIVNAARSLRALKNNREAELLYKRALAINPEAKIMDNLGVLYISAGRIAEASKLYNDMQEKYTDYTDGKVHFAQVLMQERNFQRAEQLLQSVIQNNSTHRDSLHQLSLLYSQVNRTTEALEYVLKALKLCIPLDVTCAQLHVDHGDILKDMKHWDDAAQSYRMAIELDTKLSHAHVNLAVINHLQGDCHQALRHYHEAYILDPDNQLLQENMRKLKLHLVDGSGACQGSQSATCRSR